MPATLIPRLLAVAGCLLLGACASLSPGQRLAAAAIAHGARSQQVDCPRADACAQPSPVLDMARAARAASTPDHPRHRALLLDDAPDSLLVRVHLIRSASRSIDLQTYIFDEDDSAQLVLDELQAAAFRGVKVRILIDQLSALRRVQTLAALSSLHDNLDVRIYNPVLDRARLSLPMYAVAAACCWRQLNRRMHNKLLLVDGLVGITGGRNYQDDYFDWGRDFNFRDRDILLAGPVVDAMGASFNAFWLSRRSVPAERLGDVGRYLRADGPPPAPHHPYANPGRVQALLADADDAATLAARFVEPASAVGAVDFISDLPAKHRRRARLPAPGEGISSEHLMQLLASARAQILLQTPYLVLSEPAQDVFRALQQRADPPRVRVSTNSLAATDAFITYAMSYKYKRRYLRDFGFQIHEFKPFPADAPFELGATGAGLDAIEAPMNADGANRPAADAATAPSAERATSRGSRGRARRLAQRRLSSEPASEAGRPSPFASSGGLPVRLKRAGLRMGLHAKSLVVDGRIAVVGTHNFDPRGDTLNTESAVVIDDPAFASRLSASILRDMAPGNAWTIARRPSSPILPGVEYTLAKMSERMPLFDLWPIKYATSYDYVEGPGCPPTSRPQSPRDPDFALCNRPVGDFPEVDIGPKRLGVRLFTGFGAGLSPIL